MAVLALSDLHLSIGNNKPMDIFGGAWINYIDKIKESWTKNVGETDTVIVPGDLGWGISLEDSLEDFRWLSSLPGRKILLKGNHDYW